MSQTATIYLLFLSLMAPLNSGAAAWMSLSMSEQDESYAVQDSLTADGLKTSPSDDHRHTDHLRYDGGDSHAQLHGSAHLNDKHTEADCESECLSCTNHCSSLALLTQLSESESKNWVPVSSSAHALSSLMELLLRPPILV